MTAGGMDIPLAVMAEPAARCRFCGDTTRQECAGREYYADMGQSLWICGQCGGGYLAPDLTPEALGLFYREQYRTLFTMEAARRYDEGFLRAGNFRAAAWRRAAQLVPALPYGGRVLEVGSGFGTFLAAAHAQRPDLVLVATEPDVTHRTVATAGAPVRFIDDLGQAAAEGPFHLIVLFHVLEHVPDPVQLLRELAGLLAPGGQVVVELPDMAAPWFSWFDIHPAHLSYLTRPSLNRLLFRAGLTDATGGALDQDSVLWAQCAAAAQDAPPPADAAEMAAWQERLRRYRLRPSDKWRRLVKSWVTRLFGPATVGALQRARMRFRQPPLLRDPDSPVGRLRLLGLPVDPLTADAVTARALGAMRQRRPLRQGDLNVAKLIQARADAVLALELERCDIVNADGMGIILAAWLLGAPLPERVSGIDLMERLIGLCALEGLRPYILGARPEVLEQAVARLRARHPGLQFAGWHHGYFTEAEEGEVVAAIRTSDADCLFVAMPSPRKEIFLGRHHEASGVRFAMGVGGSVDVIAGLRQRAPAWMRRAGLEWFARMVQEPRRLGPRYLSTNAAFAGLLVGALLRQLVNGHRSDQILKGRPESLTTDN